MKNEIQRFRISFANLPLSKNGGNLNQYAIKNGKSTVITCALVEEAGTTHWDLFNIGGCESFYNTPMLAYKSGAAYEAEIGQRLVNGKRMLAEDYVRSLRAAQIFNFEDLQGLKLVSTVVVYASDLERLKHDHFYGSAIDTDVCKIEEAGKNLKIEIPILDLNHLSVANSAPWSGVDKTTSMEFHFPTSMPSGVNSPLMGATMDMF